MLAAISIAFFSHGVAQPKLSLDKMEVDMGVIYSGTKKVSRLTVKNIGNQPLKILEVTPSCGCTTVKKLKQELKPNESDDIEISFDATGYRSKVEKYVSISSNDPTAQFVSVKFTADVREELEPSTMSLLMWLGSLPLGKEAEQTVKFKNISDHPIAIRGVTPSSANLSVKADKMTLKPEESISVVITLKAEKAGYSNEHFVLETDSKNQPKIEMKVSYIGVK